MVLKYLTFQFILEIVVNVIMAFLGFGFIAKLSIYSSFVENIENLQEIVWAISIMTLFASIAYIPLFFIISNAFELKKTKNKYSVLNLVLHFSIMLFLLIWRSYSHLSEVIPFLFSSIFASILIVIFDRRL